MSKIYYKKVHFWGMEVLPSNIVEAYRRQTLEDWQAKVPTNRTFQVIYLGNAFVSTANQGLETYADNITVDEVYFAGIGKKYGSLTLCGFKNNYNVFMSRYLSNWALRFI